MDKAQIITLVNNGDFLGASQYLTELLSEQNTDETSYILAATIVDGIGENPYPIICNGLKANPFNYELYFMLGNNLLHKNPDQAYLCFEQALFYCDNATDKSFIKDTIDSINNELIQANRNITIIIPYYKTNIHIRDCITSITNSLPDSIYEIIIIDNVTNSHVAKLTDSFSNLKVIQGNPMYGLGKSFNIGVDYADKNSDILFIGNDSYYYSNSIFELRMGLYSDSQIGAVSSVSNSGNTILTIEESINNFDAGKDYAYSNNIPNIYALESKATLPLQSIMLKRDAINAISKIDSLFDSGSCADFDLSLHLLQKGYLLSICWNSFVFTYNNSIPTPNVLTKNNISYFKDKWGFDISYYACSHKYITDMFVSSPLEPIKILEVGCGIGATLTKLKYMYPNSTIKGIEIVPSVALAGSYVANIIEGNIEYMSEDKIGYGYDYIICADVIEHLVDPEKTIIKLKNCLNKNGHIIFSVPNLLHMSVMLPLMDGMFEYEDSGILDRTHLHFYTRNSLLLMMERLNLYIEAISSTKSEPRFLSDEYTSLLANLESLMNPKIAKQLHDYQHVLRVSTFK